MKFALPVLVVAFALLPFAHANTLQPDLSEFSDSTAWRIQNRTASAVLDKPNAVRLDARENAGFAWLVGSDFRDGTIEFDVRGANKPGQSFVGLAFRGIDETTYDAIYFRPFNFRNPDPIRAARSVQYISIPGGDWPTLREKFPGKYEATVAPVPNPDDWFHARVILAGRKITVFVNDATEPCLAVETLSDRPRGLVGLWVGNGSAGDFANLRITPAP